MIQMRREDGSMSRTMRDSAALAVLVAFEGTMMAFQKHIPAEYMWLYPIAHAAVVMRIAYLRVTTTMGMQK